MSKSAKKCGDRKGNTVLAMKLTRAKNRCFKLVSFVVRPKIKNWSSARRSSRQSACKRKGSERALVDIRGHRVRFL